MKKIFLIMYFGVIPGRQYIKFHPFKWFFWLYKKRNFDIPRSHDKEIVILSPSANDADISTVKTMRVTFRYRIYLKIKLLCITVCFKTWQTDSDIKRIYGEKYDYKTETLEGARTKMSDLYNTGYFA